MRTLTLNGSLGERHKNINETVNKFCSEKSFTDLSDFDPINDIDNLMKVDAANHFKNLDYVIHILKSDDNLLKSRAMKCIWLFDGSAEHSRVNYFKDNLFPYISNSTKCKIIHNLSIHLKNESFAKEYFEYLYETDSRQHALKFLQSCANEFIEEIFVTKDIKLTETQLMKITEKDLNLTYKYLDIEKNRASLRSKVAALMVSADTDRFLNWFENTPNAKDNNINLGFRASCKILKSHKQRIIDNKQTYLSLLKTEAIVDVFSRDEIKEVLLHLHSRKEPEFMNKSHLFDAYTKKFRLEEQYNLLTEIYKSLFAKELPKTKLLHTVWERFLCLETKQECALVNINNHTPYTSFEEPQCYEWYSYIDFKIAYPHLREFIKFEPIARDRMNMLIVMLHSYYRTKREDDLTQVLEYFLTFHINELHRNDFLNRMLDLVVLFKCDDKSWSLVNEIFHSFNVYCATGNERTDQVMISSCLDQVLRRHLWKGIPVPKEVLELYINNKKYSIHKEDIELEEKVFHTVFEALLQKFENLDFVNDETKYEKTEFFEQAVIYVQDWNVKYSDNKKSLAQYSTLVDFIHVNKDLSLLCIHDYMQTDKNFIRQIIRVKLRIINEDSFLLYCLKHHQEHLSHPDEEILTSISQSWRLYKGFYNKLRIYFSDDIGKFWTEYYLNNVNNSEYEDSNIDTNLQIANAKSKLRHSVFALSILLEKDHFLHFMEPYKPNSCKTKCSEENKRNSVRSKLIAKFTHLVRPLLPSEVILPFTRRGYLRHVLISLTSLCHQYSLPQTEEVALNLIVKPVSVQKHGIHILLNFFDNVETSNIIMDIWLKSKSASIHVVILKNIIRFLSLPIQTVTLERHWQSLKVIIDELSGESDKKLFRCLTENISKINKTFFSYYCECSWNALKRHGDQNYLLKFLKAMRPMQKYLSGGFCQKFIAEYIEINIASEIVFKSSRLMEYDRLMLYFIVEYLLWVSDENIQNERVCKIYALLLKCLKTVLNKSRNTVKVKKYYVLFLDIIVRRSLQFFSMYANPKKLLERMLKDIKGILPLSERIYITIITELVCIHHEVFEPLRKITIYYNADLKPELLKNISHSWQLFGERSGDLVNRLVKEHFSLMNLLFQNVFDEFKTQYLHYRYCNKSVTKSFVLLSIIKGLITHKTQIHSILTAVEILPTEIEDDLLKPLYNEVLKELRDIEEPDVEYYLNSKLSKF